MVIALLVSLAATVVTGIVEYGEAGKGPLAGNGASLVSGAHSEENAAGHGGRQQGGAEPTESGIGELHGLLADITLALVVTSTELGVSQFSCIGKISSSR